MNIREIADKINKGSAGRPFGGLQQIRGKFGKSPRTLLPFAKSTIKEEEYYAFHSGGRKEFQFNIGEDQGSDEETIFRYGLAFSLHQDRTVHNAEAEFKPLVARFNDLLRSEPERFQGFSMWYYTHRQYAAFYQQVRPIEGEIFKTRNFIFIGQFFEKSVEEITDEDIEQIIAAFDSWMPLYEAVQFGALMPEKRVARICWNDEGWRKPSGRRGKSTNANLHEGMYGYGQEEWLLDLEKTVDGYHYGFLEPVQQQLNAYTGHIYDVWLYSLNAETKKCYWIGEIKHLEVITVEQADIVESYYQERGWVQQMQYQIIESDANMNGLSNFRGIHLFNVRFLPANVRVNENYIAVPAHNPLAHETRYAFGHYKDSFHFEQLGEEAIDDADNEAAESDAGATTTFLRPPKMIEMSHLHRDISKKLAALLGKDYPEKTVLPEYSAGYGGNRVDMVVRSGEQATYYEIKTYPNLKTSIRESLGPTH